ncbi:hypothetical protein [Kitasatospora sp. NPDC059673]|uniref:hypothetical protein n=1 Tax=Kitasatospora sp. NPDC059673 TaxID=3346901 RepID=UPI0036B5805F
MSVGKAEAPQAPSAGRAWEELRVHPDYRLVPAGELSASQRAALDLGDPGQVAGLLVPQRPGRTVRAVSAEAFALLSRLPGPRIDEVPDAQLACLVLDGVLELTGGGTRLSGPRAMAVLGVPEPVGTPVTRLDRISRAAVRHTAGLGLDGPGDLARRLYGYHRHPASPGWTARLATSRAVRQWLARGRPPHPRDWREVAPRPDNDRWRIYRHRRAAPGSLRHKLYISPEPSALPEVLPRVVRILGELAAPCFKVADDVYGVLRPDKLIAYLPSRARLDELAGVLAAELAGVPVQGVPFTATLTADGLLSWAVDPPPRGAPAGAESWRGWVAGRLGHALAAAGRAAADTAEPTEPAWSYALRRVRLEDVDTDTWTPLAGRLEGDSWAW